MCSTAIIPSSVFVEYSAPVQAALRVVERYYPEWPRGEAAQRVVALAAAQDAGHMEFTEVEHEVLQAFRFKELQCRCRAQTRTVESVAPFLPARVSADYLRAHAALAETDPAALAAGVIASYLTALASVARCTA